MRRTKLHPRMWLRAHHRDRQRMGDRLEARRAREEEDHRVLEACCWMLSALLGTTRTGAGAARRGWRRGREMEMEESVE